MRRRIAVVGAGIAGLAAAYELEQQRRAGAQVDWKLYEASERFGGTVETTYFAGAEGEFVLEGGPDAWVTEKPWARELAVELGLEAELIVSNDATRKTYIWLEGKLQAMPDRMRMMVPEDLATLDESPLFSPAARAAYAAELTRADELRQSAPREDESVASFVRRHFGDEVLTKLGAPLLSGVFGGDVARLSVRAVMPAFVAMEREHGSLIAAVQARQSERGNRAPQPTFTTLRRGVGSLVEAMLARMPETNRLAGCPVTALERGAAGWLLETGTEGSQRFDHVLLATPAHVTSRLLRDVLPEAATLLPQRASSAVLASFAWEREAAATFSVPPGFGFLVAHMVKPPAELDSTPAILACTFTYEKFPARAPAGCRAIRVFYGGDSVTAFAGYGDDDVSAHALAGLAPLLSLAALPQPAFTAVRRWPRSLPQYEVGHLERMAVLDTQARQVGALHLLGNSYRGVGLPDLIRDARLAAREAVGPNR